jgi:DNA polymerase-3 subunit delta'
MSTRVRNAPAAFNHPPPGIMLARVAEFSYNASMWKIIGHRQALAFFEHSRSSEHLSHAYLLTGPAQVGKETLALAFAQALFCLAEQTIPPGSPCGECRACVRVQTGTHPDLRIVQPAPGKKSLGIDEIRTLIAAAALQPQEGRFSVFVLPNAESLTIEAANALLKTLEEPAPHTIIFLTAIDDQLLPATIASRCQGLPLGPVNITDMSTALVAQWGVSSEQAQELSLLSAGRPGWAIAASQNPEMQEQRARWFQIMETLCTGGPAQRMKIATQIAREAEQLDGILAVWLSWWREILLSLEGAPVSGRRHDSHVEKYIQQIPPEAARQVLKQIQEAARQIEQNAQPRLVLETLLLDLPQLQEIR